MPKPILIGSAVRAGAAAAMAASAKVKPATQARTAPPPVKLLIGMILPPCMLLFLAYLNSLAFASGNVANECAGQLSTARVFGLANYCGEDEAPSVQAARHLRRTAEATAPFNYKSQACRMVWRRNHGIWTQRSSAS